MSSTLTLNFQEPQEFSHPQEALAVVEMLASTGSAETRGAVFTRKEVADFILDLAGYTDDQCLFNLRILEPSFGHGDFLLPVVSRLISSWKKHSVSESELLGKLGGAIVGVELHKQSFTKTRISVVNTLIAEGFSMSDAVSLADCWLHQGDFLLAAIPGSFDYVVGNPPYIRQELISPPLLSRYRQLYTTLYDRADIYIPFIERSLKLLGLQGRLVFICSDRWMKNRYGGPLRELVSRDYHLDAYVDMTGTDAFHSSVSAYTAITVIRNGSGKSTRIAHRPAIERDVLEPLAATLKQEPLAGEHPLVQEIFNVTNGSKPWILESSVQSNLLQRLEIEFPTLEQAGCKIGIGVATGADKVFIGALSAFDIESDRLLPLVETKDIRSGDIEWLGNGLVNPFRDDGQLVSLDVYPKLSRYFSEHKATLQKRHCAQNSSGKWYRTIDRIWPELTVMPKLLIPDIKGEAHVVFDEGKFYPHHNLYYVLSNSWDLRALQAVLSSRIAKLFVSAYSTKMRGGYLRFQAQYLRRIRIPYWQDVPDNLRADLIAAAKSHDLETCNKTVFDLFGLAHHERAALCGIGE